MQTRFARVINYLYGPYFKVVGFFYRIYTANRARVERFKNNRRVASVLRALTVLVLIGWILIWMMASEESRTRLVDDVKQSIGLDLPVLKQPGDEPAQPVPQ